MAKKQQSTEKKKHRRLTDNVPIKGLEDKEQVEAYTELISFYTNKEEENRQTKRQLANYYKGLKADIVRLKKNAQNRISKKKMNNVTSPNPSGVLAAFTVPSGNVSNSGALTLSGNGNGNGNSNGNVTSGTLTLSGNGNGNGNVTSGTLTDDPFALLDQTEMTEDQLKELRQGLLQFSQIEVGALEIEKRAIVAVEGGIGVIKARAEAVEGIMQGVEKSKKTYVSTFLSPKSKRHSTIFSPQKIEEVPPQTPIRSILGEMNGQSNKKRRLPVETGESGKDDRMSISPEQKKKAAFPTPVPAAAAAAAAASFGAAGNTFAAAMAQQPPSTPSTPPVQFSANSHIGSKKKTRYDRARHHGRT